MNCSVCRCLREGKGQTGCRNHMDYPEEDNCCLVSVEKNGAMTLREVAQRLGVTYARIKQIEKGALKKLELQVQRGKL